MRNILLVSWLLLPIGGFAFHEGPGQDLLQLDATDVVAQAAHAAASRGAWGEAIRDYEAALAKLPKDFATGEGLGVQRRLRLELNKARMQNKGLGEARDELDALVEELEADPKADPALLAEARQSLGRAQFFTTWLMRLEGLTREEWEPEIEAARQNFRLLAEQAADPAVAQHHQQDLEAAIRLARIEIEDLQGLPLPSE